jgi:hypothetical protein
VFHLFEFEFSNLNFNGSFPASCMKRQYGWDISCDEICARYNTDLPPYDPNFEFTFNPDVAWDPIYHNLNDFRHKQYLMERAESKRKSTDSSASLASSVPEDLMIATPPDDSPQIKRKKPEAPKRDTVGMLAERMKTFVQDFAKSYDQLKAAHEEVRLIAKEAERVNEMMFTKMTELETKIARIEQKSNAAEQNIADARLDISQLRSKCVFKAAPVTACTTTRPATATISGSAVKPPAKSAPAASSPPGASSSKKPSQEIPEVDWDDLYCAKCNTDYKPTEKHVCK